MDAFIGKKYKLDSSENFDDFLKALGLSLLTRKAANVFSPTVELRKDGDQYVLVTSSSVRTSEMKFKLGEEFEEDRGDGVMTKSVCTFDGNKIYQVMKAPDGVEVKYIREFSPEELKAVMTIKDVVCTRIYKAQ